MLQKGKKCREKSKQSLSVGAADTTEHVSGDRKLRALRGGLQQDSVKHVSSGPRVQNQPSKWENCCGETLRPLEGAEQREKLTALLIKCNVSTLHMHLLLKLPSAKSTEKKVKSNIPLLDFRCLTSNN